MANRLVLSDDEWRYIFPILAKHQHVYVGSEQALRGFMTSVLWVLRNGGAVANLAVRLWQMEQYLQAFFPLVPEGRMG